MNNYGIHRQQSHGLKADGVYGKVDNLHIYYDGNRITGVLEDAEAVTQPGSMDYPGGQREMEFGYNEWGALTKDESRRITDIEYDSFGNPVRTVFSNGSYTRNVYSAAGIKLKTEHYTNMLIPAGVTPTETDMLSTSSGSGYGIAGLEKIEYHGPVIYRNGKIDMVLFPGGYVTIDGTAVTFHYYTQDYLGNNRAVINGMTGAIEQTTAYYPYGAVIADLGAGNSGQPFKFIGKELISANSLNEYDFGARRLYPAIPQFTSIDPLCEKYRELSPYLYCGNDPVNLIDFNGMKWENPDEAEELKKVVTNRIDKLKADIESKQTEMKNNVGKWKEDKIGKEKAKIQELSSQMALLNNSLDVMAKISADDRIFTFERIDGGKHGVRTEADKIYIQTSSDALSIHEITHIGQSFENGGLSFSKDNMLKNAGNNLPKQVKMEEDAYKTQYSVDNRSMPVRVDRLDKINSYYLEKIRTSSGEMVYPFVKQYNDFFRQQKKLLRKK